MSSENWFACVGTDGTRPVVWCVGETRRDCDVKDMETSADWGDAIATVRITRDAVERVESGDVAFLVEGLKSGENWNIWNTDEERVLDINENDQLVLERRAIEESDFVVTAENITLGQMKQLLERANERGDEHQKTFCHIALAPMELCDSQTAEPHVDYDGNVITRTEAQQECANLITNGYLS